MTSLCCSAQSSGPGRSRSIPVSTPGLWASGTSSESAPWPTSGLQCICKAALRKKAVEPSEPHRSQATPSEEDMTIYRHPGKPENSPGKEPRSRFQPCKLKVKVQSQERWIHHTGAFYCIRCTPRPPPTGTLTGAAAFTSNARACCP